VHGGWWREVDVASRRPARSALEAASTTKAWT